jgi:putative peptidoglycan lipid II flippase
MTEDGPAEDSAKQGGARVAKAAGIMVAAIFASRVLALVRDMIVSYYFGAGPVTDAYNAAFRLPDFFYYLIAGGALSSAFIPVFTEYLTKDDEENAWRVFSVFGTIMALALIGIILVGEVFAPQLIAHFIAPGFGPEKLALTTSVTRIVLPAQLFFFLGGLMMATQYARQHFLMPALGPLVYNIGIIIGGIIGGAMFGPVLGIYGLAWGVLAGAFLGNVVMQIQAMRRLGVRYQWSLDWRHEGVIRVAKLMLPVMLGLSLPQLCVILTTPFASAYGAGPVTWLSTANKVMQLPLAIFAQGVSVAIFPTLSALAAKEDWDGFRRQFSLGLRSILFLTVPSAVLIAVLAVPITAFLFQRGKWTWDSTEATAIATVYYCLAIFAVSGQQIVNRGYYSMQNTLTPMVVGTVATIAFVGLNFVLGHLMQANGLALSYSLAMIGYLAALLVLFNRRIHGVQGGEIASSVARVLLASAVMGAVVWLAKERLDLLLHAYGPEGMSTVKTAAELALCGGIGGVVYLAVVKVLRVPEAEFVLSTVLRRFRRRPAQA